MTFVDKGAVVKELIFEPFVDTNDIYYKLLALDILLINTLYPLWIIGLNQDEKTSGGMAGLTFMFKKSPDSRRYNYSMTENFGYGQAELPKFLTSGGSLCQSVKNVTVRVSKSVNDNSTRPNTRVAVAAFILSVYEVDKTQLESTSGSGVGKDKNERYLFFETNGIDETNNSRRNWLLTNVHGSDNTQKWLRGVINDASHSVGILAGDGHAYFGAAATGGFGYLPAFCM